MAFTRNIGLVFFVNYICTTNINKALRTMLSVYLLLISADVLTEIIYRRGLYNFEQYDVWGRGYWLFGHANSTITFALPSVCVALLVWHIYPTKIYRKLAAVLVVLSVASVAIIQSATSIVGFVVFFSIYFLTDNRVMEKILNARKAVFGGLILCVGIVLFKVQEHFAEFFENVFHRRADFTGRTLIWEKSIDLIKNHGILGIGYRVSDEMQKLVLAPSAHNEFLYALIQGGIILLVLLLLIFFSAGKTLRFYKNNPCSRIFIAVIFSLFVQFVVETHMHRIAVLITLLGCSGLFCEEYKRQREI